MGDVLNSKGGLHVKRLSLQPEDVLSGGDRNRMSISLVVPPRIVKILQRILQLPKTLNSRPLLHDQTALDQLA
jgi:hypothetical protein